MKKNKTMRFASLLLVAVLITTCAISGTFAKYVYEGGDSASTARVAAFGVEVTATEGSGLFNTEYSNVIDDANTITVKSSTDMSVVAPGTSGSMSGVTITGKPEVMVEVAITDATVTISGDWQDASGDFYFPLTFTIGGEKVDLSSCTSGDEVAAALQAALSGNADDGTAGASEVYEPGTDLSTLEVAGVDVSWEWAFDGEDGADAKDTALGDAAAKLLAQEESESSIPAISISYGITVTQVD